MCKGMSLQEVWDRYSTANREYRRLLMRAPIGQEAGPDSPVARARKVEAEALAAYVQVLQHLARFASAGNLPEGQTCQN